MFARSPVLSTRLSSAPLRLQALNAASWSSANAFPPGAPLVLTIDGVLKDDSRELAGVSFEAARILFPDVDFGTQPWPFYKRFREIIPAALDLCELPVFLRVLMEEGIVPVGPRAGLPRRTRALNTSQITDLDNAEYLMDTLQLRWKYSSEQLSEAFRKAHEQFHRSRRLGPPGEPFDLLGPEGAQTTHTFAVSALSELRDRPVFFLSGVPEDLTRERLQDLGLDVQSNPNLHVISAACERAALDVYLDEIAAPSAPTVLLCDRLRFLKSALTAAAVHGRTVQPHLCVWGFNTPSHRALAEAEGRVLLLESLEFVQQLGLTDSRKVMDGISWN